MHLSATAIAPLILMSNTNSCTYNYKASALPLAQEFGLVTLNPSPHVSWVGSEHDTINTGG